MRFDRRIRYFGSILFIVGMILYLPVAIYVPALTFNQVTGINIHIITPVVCIVCTFYTCVGGLKAVIWTDVVQSFVMYGSILAVCIKGTLDLGGLSVVIDRNAASGRLNAPDWTWDPTVRLSMLSVIIGGTLHKIQSSDVNQVSIQRFLSLPSLKHVKQTMIIFTTLLIFLLSTCCYMGLVTYATYYDCDPISTKLARASDQLPSLLMMKTLGAFPGLPGLFVAGVFSAALSSLSTGLNSLACVISQDIIKPFLKFPLSERQMAILLRVIVIFFGIGCIGLVLIVEKLGMVLQLATMTSAVSMGPLLGVYIIGVCLPWIKGNYLERRFDRKIRLFGSVLFIMIGIMWIPISIYVPALTFNQVTGIEIHFITPAVCIVCTIYTCVGGIKGVMWTDVLQSFVMVGSLILVCIKGTIEVGGLGVVYQRNYDSGRVVAPEWTFDPSVRMGFFAVFIGATLFKLQVAGIGQVAVQRYLSLPCLQDVKKCVIIFTIGFSFLLSLCIYLGMLAYAAHYDCDPITTSLAKAKDQVVPLYVIEVVGGVPGVVGIFVSGVFSAALSSLSTVLNSLSGVILKDFIEPFRSEPLTEKQTAIVLRAVVLIFGFGAIFMVPIVKHLGLVMQLSTSVNSMVSGPLFGAFIIGMLVPFVNAKSCLSGCIAGISVMAYIVLRAQWDFAHNIMKYPVKPVSVDGCDYDFELPANFNATFDESLLPSMSKGIHHISFLWYAALGAAITIIVSLITSCLLGHQDTSEVDRELIVPFIHRFMKAPQYKSVSNLYFELRFSRRIRIFGASLFVIKAILWLPIAVYVPALTLNQVSGINIHVITPIVIIICTFYTCVGGIRAVVWTDVIQSFVMFGTYILLMIKGTIDVGGLGVIYERNLQGGRFNAPDASWDPTVRISILSVFIGGTIFKVQGTSINQPTVQRFMSLPSLKKIKQTLCAFTIGITLLYLCCVYVGLVAFATYQDCDPITTGLATARDQLVPLLMMQVLGAYPGLPGLFVSAVFSAALSSLSTFLNSLAAVILEDFVKPNVRGPLSERTTGLIMRSVVVIFGMSSILLVYLVEKLGMVLQLSATLQSILYGPMLGIFTAGMLMPWINEKSILVGSATSFLTMAWICVNAQYEMFKGVFRQPMLPVSVDGCDYDFGPIKPLNSTIDNKPLEGFSIYHISFLWYATLGAALTIIGSNVASLVFGTSKADQVPAELLADFIGKRNKKGSYKGINLKMSEKKATK